MKAAIKGSTRMSSDGRSIQVFDRFGGLSGDFGFDGQARHVRYRRPDGRPCTRTKDQYPYSYEAFVLWGCYGQIGDASVYTDRLSQWDSEKFERLRKKHFANARGWGWSGLTEEEVTNFMREFNGDPELRALRLEELCNMASGYPVWHVVYEQGKTYKAKLEAEMHLRDLQRKRHWAREKIKDIEQDTYDRGAFPAALLAVQKLREEEATAEAAIPAAEAAFSKITTSLARKMARLLAKQTAVEVSE